MLIRPARDTDDAPVWRILEPTIRAGETYALERELTESEAICYWRSKGHEVFVAEEGEEIVGTYFLHANQRGAGAHVANCGQVSGLPESVNPEAQFQGLRDAVLAGRRTLADEAES